MGDPRTSEFDTYTAYRVALHDAVERAEHEILLFDPDLGETGLESPAGAEALKQFLLRANAGECLRVVLAETGLLDRHSPRLLRLLATYGHKFAVRTVDRSTLLQPPCQPFAVIDGRHLVTRFHEDRPRGKASFDDATACAPLAAQFETIWINAQPTKSGSTLGL